MAEFHEVAPDQTIPQGAQYEGVNHVHEERDVNFRALIGWFVGLAVAAAAIHVILWAVIALWTSYVQARERVPSPLFLERPVPPGPRVLPNPADSPEVPTRAPLYTSEPLMGPQQFAARYRQQEAQRLADLGLLDPATGRPKLPDEALRRVVGEPAPGTGPGQARPAPEVLQQWAPSDASGGLAPEDRLR